MKKKPVVGQIVWVVSNRKRDKQFIEFKVVKVGSKYFHAVEKWSGSTEWSSREIPFNLDSWGENSEFAPRRAYETKEEYQAIIEGEKLQRDVLDQLRAIKKILTNEP